MRETNASLVVVPHGPLCFWKKELEVTSILTILKADIQD